MNEVEMEHRITAVEKLAKGNERRIGDLESDNKALLDLSTSVAVMAEQMKTMSSKVDSMDTAVKRLQSVPASRWEGLIKAAVTAIVAGLVGYALALAGLGGEYCGRAEKAAAEDEGAHGAGAGLLLHLRPDAYARVGNHYQDSRSLHGPHIRSFGCSDLRGSGVRWGAAAPAVQESICETK